MLFLQLLRFSRAYVYSTLLVSPVSGLDLRSHKQRYFNRVRIEIKEIGPADVLPLRNEILRPGRPLDDCKWIGDELPESFHLGAFVDGELSSIASFYQEGHPGIPSATRPYRLRGMATNQSARNQRLGTAILQEGMNHARHSGGDLLWCNARVHVAEFYLRLGFTQVGEPFEMPPVGPHVLMFTKL